MNLYKITDSYPLIFKTKQNSLDPLTIDKPKSISLTYQIYRPMTHDDAAIIRDAELPADLLNLILVAQYKSESGKTYYTKFSPLRSNEHLTKILNLNQYEKI